MAGGLHSITTSMSGADLGYFAARSVVALALGALIGLERQWRQRGAGLRTNALVALGACLFELFAVMLSDGQGADPTRIAAYIVSGVGFLGGGVILRQGGSISGINTAATIWCSAAVGTFAGAGYLGAASVAAVLIVVLHLGLRPVARRIDRLPVADEVEIIYRFRAVCRASDEAHIRVLVVQALTNGPFHLRALRSSDLDAGGAMVGVVADVACFGREDVELETAVSRLSMEPSVTSVRWFILEEQSDDELEGVID